MKHVIGIKHANLRICQEITSKCKNCAFYNRSQLGYLPQISIIPDGPWHTLGMDTLIMPKTSSGNTGVLVVVDLFTSFVFLFPIKKHDAEETADKLLLCYAYCGTLGFSKKYVQLDWRKISKS
jgi:hypothetical protein